ncbi:hypothetical protein [Planktotalea sp.]|uniref:hypothetical protein n=1 Tax=Planktotalea sp. TaxID=2029877 RepID=UPI0025FFE682|nr:hypothetical protein [Planktotalea sp.]
MSAFANVWHIASWLMQRLTLFFLIALAASAAVYTITCAFAYAEWLYWSIIFRETIYP